MRDLESVMNGESSSRALFVSSDSGCGLGEHHCEVIKMVNKVHDNIKWNESPCYILSLPSLCHYLQMSQ